MFAQVNILDIVVVLVYLFITAFLGWLGYRGTKSTADYLLAGRKAHPFIMALSYGATFISTSAIVGFGGVAGLFGMSLLWLTFCNIFVGIFIAFVLLGGPTRRMGHNLDAHTFPELLGRRFQSKFIQVFAGLVVAVFMPLYGAAVLIGGTEFFLTTFHIEYDMALLLFALIVAAYVIFGGLKGVMYTDAFQGALMFVGMVFLLVYTYSMIGGVTTGHQTLTGMADLVPGKLKAIGHQGWTAMPQFGFGKPDYDLWWIVVSTIVLGVGIGVLAQPQLVVRFMTVKSKRELNRAVGIGGIFILAMTGVAFTIGSLSNAWFAQHGPVFKGRVLKVISEAKGHALLQLMKPDAAGGWMDLADLKSADGKTLTNLVLAPRLNPDWKPTAAVAAPELAAKPADALAGWQRAEAGKWLPVATVTNADGTVVEAKIVPVVLDAAQPVVQTADRGPTIVQGRSIAIVYARGTIEQIIPTFINTAMPKWFGVVFLLTLLAAAMSTLSSQFHTVGTAIGRDVFEQVFPRRDQAAERTVYVVRVAIFIGFVAAVLLGHYFARRDYIVARFTAIFFGLCATTFLPAFVGGLFWRRMTRAGAIASMLVGFCASTFWLLFVKEKEAGALGLVQLVTGGKSSILWDCPNWPNVDPLVVGLPLSVLAAVVVSLFTRPPSAEHLARCFPTPNSKKS